MGLQGNRARQEKLNGMLGERSQESERSNGAAEDRRAGTLLVGHDLVVIDRLVEIG